MKLAIDQMLEAFLNSVYLNCKHRSRLHMLHEDHPE